jgi:hypothetical protein
MQGCAYPVSSLWMDVLRTCCTYGDGEWVLFAYLTTSHSLYLCSTSTGLVVHASSHTTLHTLPSLSLPFCLSRLLSSPVLYRLRLRLRQAGNRSLFRPFPFFFRLTIASRPHRPSGTRELLRSRLPSTVPVLPSAASTETTTKSPVSLVFTLPGARRFRH